METTTHTNVQATPKYKCRCGYNTTGIARDANDKCPKCYTFSLDHEYVGDYERCYICDTRLGSHR